MMKLKKLMDTCKMALSLNSEIYDWTLCLSDKSLSVTTENYMNAGNYVRHSLHYG